MKKNIKKIITMLIAIFLLSVSILPTTERADAGVVEWVFCKYGGADFVKAKDTDWIQYLIRNKSAYGGQEKVEDNILNQMLQFSGYNILGGDSVNTSTTPFNKYGLTGLKFSSYGGEWKYYDLDPCNIDTAKYKGLPQDDFGRYYGGRIEPQSTYQQTHDSTDVRVQQFNKSIISQQWTVFQDSMANLIFTINKVIVSFLLIMVGLSLSNIPNMIGFTSELQSSMFINLYDSLFVPLFVFVAIISGVVIAYRGFVKREYRSSFNAAVITIVIFILTGFVVYKPSIVTLPNDVATTIQALVLGAFPTGDGSDEICSSTVGIDTESQKADYLSSITKNMRSSVGCRIWNNFLFKPWLQGQFGSNAQYKDLDANTIKAEKWVGEPKVKLGSKEIKNWGLFALSANTNRHDTVNSIQSPLINGVHKDYYRVVDAMSGIKYEGTIDEQKTLQSFLPGEGETFGDVPTGAGNFADVDEGDILQRGREYVPIVESMLQKYGLDSSLVPILLGIAEQESNFGKGSGECGRLDPFQSAESLGLPPCGIKDPAQSIDAGAKHFNRVVKKAEKYNLSIWAAVQSYNFGDGYLDWLSKKGVDHSLENALQFSNEMATKLGWKSGQISYNNHVSANIVGVTYRYSYGVAHYAHEVAYKAGLSNEEVKAVAMGDGGTLPGYNGGFSSGRIVNITPGGIVQEDEAGNILLMNEVKYTPTKYWQGFIGNDGGRIQISLTSLLFTIVGLLAPLIIAVTSTVYSLGLAILSVVAPVFLLIGAWPGRGQAIFMNWLNTLLSVALKKILSGLLLIVSIYIVGYLFDNISKNGFFISLFSLTIISAIIIKNRDKIMSRFGGVNLQGAGTMTNEGIQTVRKGVSFGAKYVVGSAGATVLGAYVARRSGMPVSKGIEIAQQKNKENMLYTAGTFGMRAMQVQRALSSDRQDGLAKGKYGNSGILCISCSALIKPGDTVFVDNNGNYICEVCGDEHPDDLTEMIVPLVQKDTASKPNEDTKVNVSKNEFGTIYNFYLDIQASRDKERYVDSFIEEELQRLEDIIIQTNKETEETNEDIKIQYIIPDVIREKLDLDADFLRSFEEKINDNKHNPEEVLIEYRDLLQDDFKNAVSSQWDNSGTIKIAHIKSADDIDLEKINDEYKEKIFNVTVNDKNNKIEGVTYQRFMESRETITEIESNGGAQTEEEVDIVSKELEKQKYIDNKIFNNEINNNVDMLMKTENKLINIDRELSNYVDYINLEESIKENDVKKIKDELSNAFLRMQEVKYENKKKILQKQFYEDPEAENTIHDTSEEE